MVTERILLASKDWVMVTEKTLSASTRDTTSGGERILHPCATRPTSPLQTQKVEWSRLPIVF